MATDPGMRPTFAQRVKRWLDEPLGGRTRRELRAEDPRRGGFEVAADERSVLATGFAAPLDAGPEDGEHLVPLAMIVVEANLHRAEEQEEALVRVGRNASELRLAALRAVQERLGAGAWVGGVRVTDGSVLVTIPVFLTVGTPLPDDIADRLTSVAEAVRDLVLSFLGPMAAWANAMFNPGPGLSPTPAAAADADAADKPERGDLQLVRWLASGIVFLGATLTAIKVSDDDLLHVRLNQPFWLTLALGVIVAGSLVAVFWPALQNRGGVRRWVMFWLTATAVVVGLAVMGIVWLANASLSAEIKPRIEAKVTGTAGEERLTATISSDGIPDDRYLKVFVAGVGDDERETTLAIEQSGADRDGKVEVKLDLAASAKDYAAVTIRAVTVTDQYVKSPSSDCDDLKDKIACLRLQLRPQSKPDAKPTPDPGRPRLSATWKVLKGHAPILAIHARASALAPGDRLLLSVRPRHVDGDADAARGRIFGATWAAEADGSVDERAEVPVAATRDQLCVILRALPSGAAPPAKGAGYGPCAARQRGIAVLVGRPPR